MIFTLRDAIDILIVAYVIYRVIRSIQGTRATTLVKGLAAIFVGSVLARALSLRTVSWLLDHATTLILVALPVVFYPELRRGLEQIGRGQIFGWMGGRGLGQDVFDLEAIIRAVGRLSAKRIGALIVLQRQEGLHEFLETGVKLDALISTELVLNIFEPKSPLHDGAIILSGGRIVSAGSVLPLTDSPLSGGLGTRHRAAVGMSEQTDAVVIVVSEETGTISLAVGGHLRRYLTEARLREQLQFYWRGSETR
ncbi:MAG: diadenylate cyclase CdaA [Bacillota bacterium]|nr:diadenylate cyclase CdaA [Bacillota bacterium]HHT90515.1 TIGR00159 family protein [Bacillota bacterium]